MTPKGSGGPPTGPSTEPSCEGYYWQRGQLGWHVVEVKLHDDVLVVDDGSDEDESDLPTVAHYREWAWTWGPRIPTPDESEPAPPTDGPTENLAEEVSRMVHAFSDDGRRLAVRDLAHRIGTALAESRAEVERLRARANAGVDIAACHVAAEQEVVQLRDRVRVLEEALRDTAGNLDPSTVRGRALLERANGLLATTQEPPAKKDDHGKR